MNASAETTKVEELSREIADTQNQIKDIAKERDSELGKIGNIIHDSCPVDKDEVSAFTHYNK